jgi:hypothetical protein
VMDRWTTIFKMASVGGGSRPPSLASIELITKWYSSFLAMNGAGCQYNSRLSFTQ